MACAESRRRAGQVRRCQFTVTLPSGFWKDGQRTETVPSSLRTRMSNSRSLRSQPGALRRTSSAS